MPGIKPARPADCARHSRRPGQIFRVADEGMAARGSPRIRKIARAVCTKRPSAPARTGRQRQSGAAHARRFRNGSVRINRHGCTQTPNEPHNETQSRRLSPRPEVRKIRPGIVARSWRCRPCRATCTFRHRPLHAGEPISVRVRENGLRGPAGQRQVGRNSRTEHAWRLKAAGVSPPGSTTVRQSTPATCLRHRRRRNIP